jgi:hypothetical protein
MEEAVEQMISVGDLIFFFSKQTALRGRHRAQQIAAKPTIYTFFFWTWILHTTPKIG